MSRFLSRGNVRLGSELLETKKKFEIMKTEIEKFQNQRSSLIEKINSVNDVIKDTNVLTNVFDNSVKKEGIKVYDYKLEQTKKIKLDLSKEVEKIFSKK